MGMGVGMGVGIGIGMRTVAVQSIVHAVHAKCTCVCMQAIEQACVRACMLACWHGRLHASMHVCTASVCMDASITWTQLAWMLLATCGMQPLPFPNAWPETYQSSSSTLSTSSQPRRERLADTTYLSKSVLYRMLMLDGCRRPSLKPPSPAAIKPSRGSRAGHRVPFDPELFSAAAALRADQSARCRVPRPLSFSVRSNVA
eukprot:366021-Chlamydomonas_euryale.AAC.10